MTHAKGIVFHEGSKEGIAQATIKAVKGSKIVYATADDNGDFEFDVPDPGTWDFSAFEKKCFASEPKQVDMSQDQTEIKLYLSRIAESQDDDAGRRFLWTLLGVLGGLIIIYLLLHFLIRQDLPPLSQASVTAVNSIKQQIASSQDISKDEALKSAVTNLQNDLAEAITQTNRLSTSDKSYISQTVADIQKSIDSGQKDRAVSLLADLQQVIDPSPSFDFWSMSPLRYLEIILWGLGGILVSKIVTTGWYLRGKRFYREGILMHIAHIATTPILVLVIVLLLSLVTLKVTLVGGNEIAIDLSDPRIMVAFAFIIGTSPWPLWKFVQDSAKKFMGQ